MLGICPFCVKPLDTKWFQELFQLSNYFIFSLARHISQNSVSLMIDSMPKPALLEFITYKSSMFYLILRTLLV